MVTLLIYVLSTWLVSDSLVKFNFVTELGPIFISFKLLRVYIIYYFIVLLDNADILPSTPTACVVCACAS